MRQTAAGFLLAVLAALAAGFLFLKGAHGLSARAEPSRAEAAVARRLRRLALPREAAAAQNPVPASAEVLREARDHFADHCAACHGNDGSGRTEIGRNLYPKPPDLRLPDSQRLSDGELFFIIQNGVRFTGMPAWADSHGGEGGRDSWELVRFIRHLPSLTPAELREMEASHPHEHDEAHEHAHEHQAEPHSHP